MKHLALLMVFVLYTTLLHAKECHTLSATGNSEYPPYLWRKSNDSDQLIGAIDFIIQEIAIRIKREINLKHVGSWSRAQAEVKSGRVDMIAGAFYTVPRNQWMDYVYPAFLNTSSVVWRQNNKLHYTQKNDLIDKLGVTVINNSFGHDFDEFAKQKLRIESVASLEQAFKMLALGRVDYALYEKNPGLAYANKLGIADEIEPLMPPVSTEGLYLTISHESKCNTGKLRGQLAKAIRELQQEGFNQKALQLGLVLRTEIAQ